MVPSPAPITDAPHDQRFHVGQWVSHNGGMIELDNKRQISGILGYDKNGGVSYTLTDPAGRDMGMAYDMELDLWPQDESLLPMRSPRTLTMFECDRSPEMKAMFWQERWLSSDPQRGSSIVTQAGDLVAHFGGDVETHALVGKVVQIHNTLLHDVLTKTQVEKK